MIDYNFLLKDLGYIFTAILFYLIGPIHYKYYWRKKWAKFP